jgi:DNA-directed RNA polymerase specialized sigma24 family protein
VNTEALGDVLPGKGKGSLCEQPAVRDQLWAIVARLECHPASWDREDLFQEALLQLWRIEQTRPAQSASWYLQNVAFRLRDLVKAGRSLDSAKRHSRRVELRSDEADEAWEATAAGKKDLDPMYQSYADDLREELRRRLNGVNAGVFDLLLQGFGTREIARRVRVAVGTVVGCRQAIAILARALDNRGGLK